MIQNKLLMILCFIFMVLVSTAQYESKPFDSLYKVVIREYQADRFSPIVYYKDYVLIDTLIGQGTIKSPHRFAGKLATADTAWLNLSFLDGNRLTFTDTTPNDLSWIYYKIKNLQVQIDQLRNIMEDVSELLIHITGTDIDKTKPSKKRNK